MKLHPRRPFRSGPDLDQDRRVFVDAAAGLEFLRPKASAKLVDIVFYLNEVRATDNLAALPIHSVRLEMISGAWKASKAEHD
jgi:hypothetical protein